MAIFVLVPDGLYGGWYFRSLAEALRARSRRAYRSHERMRRLWKDATGF